MKHCTHCNVDVAGKREECPLCQNTLAGDTTSLEQFPYVKTIYNQYSLFFRFFMFVSIVSAVVLVTINLILEDTGYWSVFYIAGLLCIWLSLSLAIKKKKNIPIGMLYQAVLISVISIAWDHATGWRGWSLDYVIPILCLSVLVTLAILSWVFSWEIDNIILYFGVAGIFGITPLIFYLTGLLVVKIPSIICIGGSLISIAAILIFKGDRFLAELKRRFSI